MTRVSTQAELAAAISEQERNIVVTASFNITATQTITYNVTISGDESGPHTLTKDDSFSDEIFVVTSNGWLTLTNIVLDGAKATHAVGGSLVKVTHGLLHLSDGAVLQNNNAVTGGGVSSGNSEEETILSINSNAVIRDNFAQNNGGGIYVTSNARSLVEIGESAVIENNRAQISGGGIYFDNNYDNTFFVAGSTKITGNSATNGGGINVAAGSVQILGLAEIFGNTATYGGGIALYGRGINAVDNVQISNNNATGAGGGLYVKSNSANVVMHCLCEENTSPRTGGVYIEDLIEGNLDLSHSRFSNNHSTSDSDSGGALCVRRVTEGSSTLPINLDACDFLNNTSGFNGGGVCIQDETPSMFELTADGGRFQDNVAANIGGAIYVYAAENSLFQMNSTIIYNNRAAYGGGCGIFHNDSGQFKFYLSNVLFEKNHADHNAAGLYVGDGNQEVVLNSVTMRDGTAQNSGALESNRGSGSILINNSGQFFLNHAENNGGAIDFYGSRTLILENVYFDQNTAITGKDIRNSGSMQIGSKVQLLSGFSLPSRSDAPTITQNLSVDSDIQLEQSAYIAPDSSDFPLLLAVADSDITLTEQDSDAFHLPFNTWQTRLSEDNTQVLADPRRYEIVYENTKGAENPNPSFYTVVTPTVVLTNLPDTGGLRFLGWFDAPEGGNQVTQIPRGSSGEIVLYGRWDTILHSVIYFGNDAGGPPAENVPLPQTVLDGDSVTLSDESPTRNGYLFLRWNTAADGTGVDYNPEETVFNVKIDLGLYAQWLPLPPTEHVLAYHPNDEEGTPAHGMPENSVVADGDTARISSQIPTREGYRFVEWNTVPTGSGIRYRPNDSIPEVRGNIDLYAQWKLLPRYTLTYHGNDAGGAPAKNVPDPVTVAEGESIVLSSEIPTRSGYRFTGWNTASDGSGIAYQPGETLSSVTADAHLYAQWKPLPPNYFNVYFIANDCGRCRARHMPYTMRIAENQSARIPCIVPCLPCYRFIGWNTRADGCGIWYAPGQPVTVKNYHKYLYAQWR